MHCSSAASPPPGSSYDSLVIDAFRANGLAAPRPAVYTHAINLRVSLAATGPFLAIVAATTVDMPSKYPSIRKLAVDLPTARQAVHVVTLRKRTLSPLARLFLDCAREIAEPPAREHDSLAGADHQDARFRAALRRGRAMG